MLLFPLLAALPFGWGLGLLIARIIAGPDVGQLPAATIWVGFVVGWLVALVPLATPQQRAIGMLVAAPLLMWLAGF